MNGLGIDLGTSNVLAAECRGNEPRTLDLEPPDRRLPAAAYLPSSDMIDFGLEALKAYENGDSNAVRRWKQKIDSPTPLVPHRTISTPEGAKETTAYELTAALMRRLIDILYGDGVGRSDPPERVVVTVPNGWRRTHPESCRRTRQAASQHLPNGTILPVVYPALGEPSAAAAAVVASLQQTNRPRLDALVGQDILVVDVGGGTFDATILRLQDVKEETIELIVRDALHNDCAGDEADANIVANLVRLHKWPFPDDPQELLLAASQGDPLIRSALRSARDIKESAGRNAAREIKVNARGTFHLPPATSQQVEVTPEWILESLTHFRESGRNIVTRLIDECHAAPRLAVLCGGGSQIPGVRNEVLSVLSSRLDPEPLREAFDGSKVRWADEAIVRGAAIVAAGKVTLCDRLMYDVYVLAIFEDQPTVLGPVLQKGDVLPAVASKLERVILSANAQPGPKELCLLLYDGGLLRRVARYRVERVAPGASARWLVHADAEGALEVEIAWTGGTMPAVLTNSIEGGVEESSRFSEADIRRMRRISLDELIESAPRAKRSWET